MTASLKDQTYSTNLNAYTLRETMIEKLGKYDWQKTKLVPNAPNDDILQKHADPHMLTLCKKVRENRQEFWEKNTELEENDWVTFADFTI